jgi:uncharacterized membrane protein
VGETTLEPQAAAAPAGGTRRLDSIDLLRGLIMVIMALDHVRDYWHHDSLVARDAAAGIGAINPVNLDETSGWLFLTRWVTHFCAPTFLFLAGTGAFLYGSRGRTKLQLAWFLVSRGLWLMVADMTLSRLGWAFQFWSPDDHGVWGLGGGIIWVIGAAMVLMAVLVFLPTSAVAAFGVAVIAFHNLLDTKTAADLHLPQWVWGVLHAGGGEVVRLDARTATDLHLPEWIWGALHSGGSEGGTVSVTFGAGYGLLPCLGMMAAGYALGALYLLEPAARRRQLLGLGLTLTALFVVLRFSNLYGDPTPPRPPVTAAVAAGVGGGITAVGPNPSVPGPWSVREPWYFTIFSFLNCQKYPASLLYILMTLGPSITLLGLFEWARGPVARFFVVFGRVPLFFYLLHVPLIHGLMVGLDYLRFGWSPMATDGCWSIGAKQVPPDYGVSLPVVYLVWVAVVLLLYPLCWWYAGVKQRYRWAWLSYL